MLLEQGKLTSGSTWHAAGLVGQLRSSASITRVLKYSVDLYKRLEAETGLATGWKMTGCLRLATNQDRWTEYQAAGDDGAQLRHGHASAVARGGESDVAADGDRRSGRRKLAADRRAGKPLRHHPVAGQGRAHARRQDLSKTCASPASSWTAAASSRSKTDKGDIACEKVVNCAGQWARQVGAMAGINVPLQPVQASIYHHRKDRRAGNRCADAPRSRPAHLFQGRGRRAGHGRLRAKPAGLDHRAMCRATGNSASSTMISTISSSI